MKRVLFTSFMVGVVALGAQARQSPPHIVLILCDDMGFSDLKSICLVIIQSCSVKETFGYQHLASPQKSSVWAYRFHNGTYLA